MKFLSAKLHVRVKIRDSEAEEAEEKLVDTNVSAQLPSCLPAGLSVHLFLIDVGLRIIEGMPNKHNAEVDGIPTMVTKQNGCILAESLR